MASTTSDPVFVRHRREKAQHKTRASTVRQRQAWQGSELGGIADALDLADWAECVSSPQLRWSPWI